MQVSNGAAKTARSNPYSTLYSIQIYSQIGQIVDKNSLFVTFTKNKSCHYFQVECKLGAAILSVETGSDVVRQLLQYTVQQLTQGTGSGVVRQLLLQYTLQQLTLAGPGQLNFIASNKQNF